MSEAAGLLMEKRKDLEGLSIIVEPIYQVMDAIVNGCHTEEDIEDFTELSDTEVDATLHFLKEIGMVQNSERKVFRASEGET